MAFVLGVDLQIQNVLGLEKVKQQLAGIQIGGVGQAKNLSAGLQKVSSSASSVASNTAKAGNATAKLGQSVQGAGKKVAKAANEVKNFGDSVFLAGRRYGAFIAATAVAFKVVQVIGAGTKSVIEFDQAIVSLSQIMNTPISQLADLSQKFLDLSVATGTSAADISEAAKLLAQAGFRGNDLTEAVEQLAKIPLTPIFESMEQSVDGVIAVMRQFSNEGLTVEQVFDKMLRVQNDYAASFPDLIEGFKRGGSAFAAIGGTADEFIAAFTTIRSVTRESASSVGTSLKTLSSRLADPKIVQFLETKGIRIFEEGQFVGPIQAIKRIGDGLQRTIDLRDKTEILIKLGGRRQFSRVVAIANNAKLTNEILGKSQDSWGTLNKTAEQGLKAVGKQIDIIVAKGKKLAIELGENLFLPFISGLTGTAEAAIALLSALKPILPVLAQIGGLVAGAAITGGIGGFLGPKIAQLAGPAAFAAAGGGLTGFAKGKAKAQAGLAASPFAQAGLLIAAAELTSSFLKAEDGTNTFASTLISSTALIAAAIALFRKQTIAQFAATGGLFPGLAKLGKLGAIGGAVATAGIIALPLAVLEAQKSSQELSDKIVENAVRSISDIEIDPTNAESFGRGLSQLYTTIGDSVGTLIKSTDLSRDPSLSKLFQGIGRQFTNVFEGDFATLISKGGLTQKDVDDQVQEIVKGSPEVVNNIMESIANSLVFDDKKVSPSSGRVQLIREGRDLGLTTKAASLYADAIIRSVGGLEEWTKGIQRSADVIRDELDKRKKLANLAKGFIPPKLVSQLSQFSKAVEKTTRAISVSARAFETQVSEIRGGIVAPSFDFDFGGNQIKQLISGGGLKDIFSFTPDIPKFVGGLSEIESLLDQFIINISNLPAGSDLTTEIDKFFDFQDTPRVVRDNFGKFFATIAEDITAASEGKLITADEIKSRFEKQFEGLGTGASDAVVETVGKFLTGTFAQIQDELNRLSIVRQLELAVPVRPETQAEFLREQLRRSEISVGGGVPSNRARGTIDELELRRREAEARGGVRAGQGFLPTPPQGFFQGRGQQLVDIAGDERVRQQVRDSFAKLTLDLSKARKELSALKPGAEGFTFAAEKAKELARQVIELQVSLEALDQATRQAATSELETLKLRQQFELRQTRTGLERSGRASPLEAQRTIFDLQQEHIQQQIELQDKYDNIVEKDNALRASLAKEISAINKTETQEFGKSVTTFADATRIQVTAAELMLENITSFGHAVVDFRNLNATSQPLGDDSSPRITANQIKSGGVNIQQAFDEFNRLLNEGNGSQKDLANILNAIHDRQEQTQPVQQESSEVVGQSERDTEASEKISQLTESLDNLRVVINEPNEMKLVTDQRIDLDLSALPADITEAILPLLQEAVTIAAKTVTRKAMESLASKGDSELSIAATDTAQELI